MPTAAPAGTTELREAVLGAWRTLRARRKDAESKGVLAGGELAQAERRYDTLCRDYILHRVAEGLGPDPEVIDRERFEEILYQRAAPGRFARHVRDTKPSCLSRDTMTRMLASATELGPLLEAVRSVSGPRDAFDQHTPLRRHMRAWAEQTASDPFVRQCLEEIAAHVDELSKAVDDATTLLNNLRMRYERKHGGADRLAVERDEDGRLDVVARTGWDALEEHNTGDAGEVMASVAAAELAGSWLDRAAKDLNRELSRFFAELIPRQFALLAHLPRKKRKERTGGVRLSAALAARLVDAAETTDFVADPELKLGFERQKLPRWFRLLATRKGYRRVRDVLHGRKVQNASTVIFRRRGPAPRPEDGPDDDEKE
jgi:hypothetical protein